MHARELHINATCSLQSPEMVPDEVPDLPSEGTGDNRERTSTKLCVAGLGFCWLAGLTSLATGVYLICAGGVLANREWIVIWVPDGIRFGGGVAVSLGSHAQEFSTLGLNAIVTLCNDITGYIHTVSLRWALQRESRLTFNSNLRLFSSARRSKSNAWYTNTIMAIFMVMGYASTSLIFIGDEFYASYLSRHTNVFICGYALITLAISLLGQAVIATICIPNLAKVHTWSPDPLVNARACLAARSIEHRPGRSLRSVHHLNEDAVPVSPSSRQRTAFSAHREVRIVFWCMSIPVALAAVWGGIILYAVNNTGGGDELLGNNWSLFPTVNPGSGLRKATTSVSVPLLIRSFGGFCLIFIVVGAIQSFMTISLHCAELIVNVIRDEQTWRSASKRGLTGSNALVSMLRSYPALALFIAKPVLHWLYSLACAETYSSGISMRAPQIFYLAAAALVVTAFTTACAMWRPKGPQPSAYGHLQTLADLVDEWPHADHRMFWGEKDVIHAREDREDGLFLGEGQPSGELVESDRLIEKKSVWHAGTAREKLPPVRFDRKYM